MARAARKHIGHRRTQAALAAMLVLASLATAVVLAAPARAAAKCTINWTETSGSEHLWNNGNNWTGEDGEHRTPGSEDHVCIPAGVTVEVYPDPSVQTIQSKGTVVLWGETMDLLDASERSSFNVLVDRSTIEGAGSFVVTGTFTWEEGELSGSGTTEIAAGAKLQMTNSAEYRILSRTLQIDAGGTAEMSAANASLVLGETSISNAGTFLVAGENDDIAPETTFGGLVNTGTFSVEGAGFSAGGISVENEGTFELHHANLPLQSFHQGAKGVLHVRVGIAAEPPVTHLTVEGGEGSAQLGGTLEVTTEAGFHPALGQHWPVVEAAKPTGAFATITETGEGPGAGLDYEGVYNATAAEVSVVKKPATTTATSLSGGGKSGATITVPNGTAASDQATLGGAHIASAGGHVSYAVYSDSSCSKLVSNAGTVEVTAGKAGKSEEKALLPGTYYWQASYTGDRRDEGSQSACGSEVETIETAPTTTTTKLTGAGKSGEAIMVPSGTPVTDQATLAGAQTASAGGHVSYAVYSDSSCSKLVSSAGTVAVAAGKAGASEAETLPPGTYYWQATYTGDAHNAASHSTCGSEVEAVELALTTTSTKLSGGASSGVTITVPNGTAVSDQATLAGAHAATAGGHVTYTVYSDSECTKPVTAAGTEVVEAGKPAPSEPETLPPGTYHWQASYSGDATNASSVSPCTEVETVEAPVPTEAGAALTASGTSASSVVVTQGTAVTEKATLTGPTIATASGEVLYAVYSDASCAKLVTKAGAAPVHEGKAAGSEAEVLPAGTYYWQASYTGDAAHEASKTACGSLLETVLAPQTGGHGVLSNTTVEPKKPLVLPPPVLGKTVNVEVVSGTVLIKYPSGYIAMGTRRPAGEAAVQKGAGFVPLTEPRQIPVGSELDTTNGTVRLTTATATANKTQAGEFGAGLFNLLQNRKQKGLTELRIVNSRTTKQACVTVGKGKKASVAKKLSSTALGRLKANSHGKFTIHGTYSAGTVRGTTWGVRNQCNGTLTIVTRGKVEVRDFIRRKTIMLFTGQQYLAKP